MTVIFTSRISASAAPLKHAWEHTVGSSRAALALRSDWQEQLRGCHDELGFRHVRFHGLLTDAPAPLAAYIERIDEDHANPRRRWREMGEPEYPRRSQVEQLEAASRLVKEPLGFSYENRTVRFDVDLPPHSVAAVTLELAPESSVEGAAP